MFITELLHSGIGLDILFTSLLGSLHIVVCAVACDILLYGYHFSDISLGIATGVVLCTLLLSLILCGFLLYIYR